MVTKELSPAFSFQGWNVKEFLKGNWSTIKNLVKIGVPFFLGIQFFADNPALIASVTVIGKGLLDIAEYYVFKQ